MRPGKGHIWIGDEQDGRLLLSKCSVWLVGEGVAQLQQLCPVWTPAREPFLPTAMSPQMASVSIADFETMIVCCSDGSQSVDVGQFESSSAFPRSGPDGLRSLVVKGT